MLFSSGIVHCQSAGEPSDSQDMLNTVQLDLLPTRSRRKELAVPAVDRGPKQIIEGMLILVWIPS